MARSSFRQAVGNATRSGSSAGTAAGERFERFWPLLYVLFLPNLGAPISALLHSHADPLRLAVALMSAALFIAVYLWAAWRSDLAGLPAPSLAPRSLAAWRWGPVVVLTGLSVVLIVAQGSSCVRLLILTGAVAGGRLLPASALGTMCVLALLAVLLGWTSGDTAADVGAATLWTIVAVLLTMIVCRLRRTIGALHAAREENARLAVETERLRFARDLHDLLGQDLTRIALQSDVAEALAFTVPERSLAAVREIGTAARAALHEVRAAVAGYRQPTLASELCGAVQILAAAGIAARQLGEPVAVHPAVEAVLAWTVREGVTNVVKHSHARHCTLALADDGDTVCVAVIDDGHGGGDGTADSAEASGSGLAGLAERAAALGGTCEAGPRPEGGFRLVVRVPAARASRERAAEPARRPA
jgi:two-component system sensor histidine kinase DesK